MVVVVSHHALREFILLGMRALGWIPSVCTDAFIPVDNQPPRRHTDQQLFAVIHTKVYSKSHGTVTGGDGAAASHDSGLPSRSPSAVGGPSRFSDV